MKHYHNINKALLCFIALATSASAAASGVPTPTAVPIANTKVDAEPTYLDDLGYFSGYARQTESNGYSLGADGTHAWQVDFRHYFNPNLALSFAYLNEGHIFNRKRDGVTPELWFNLPLFHNYFALAVGAGPYRYYDTIGTPQTSSANNHGWGAIVSASATWNLPGPLFFRITANHEIADPRTRSVLFGAGIRLGENAWAWEKYQPCYEPIGSEQIKNELTAFFGKTVHNSFADLDGESFGLEYRRRLATYVDWSAGWLYQDDPGELQRNGAATQLWLVHDYLDRHLTLGVGAGAYVFHDSESDPAYHSNFSDSVGELVSGMVEYRFTAHWNAKFTWNRVATKYNHDTDDYVLGIGYGW